MTYKPISEDSIDNILKTHPELTREYVIEKHKEIHELITDEMVYEKMKEYQNFEDNSENDDNWIWDFENTKSLLTGMLEADADLTMDWKFVKEGLKEKFKTWNT